jgi:N-acetylglucosaminyl-diphospho-decaprenol L-rhamnosyltransferase
VNPKVTDPDGAEASQQHDLLAQVSIVIVLHNSEATLPWCLQELPQSSEVVLVDNASLDSGLATALSIRPDATVVEMDGNRGFGAGGNAGARRATREVLVILNPDVRIDSRSLEHLAHRSRAERGVLFGPELRFQDGAIRHTVRRPSTPLRNAIATIPRVESALPQRLRRDLSPDDPIYADGGAVAYLQGACLALARRSFLELGGFDERFFLYSEEEDLCRRARANGGACVYDPHVHATHVGGTSTAASHTPKAFHIHRSQVLYQGVASGRTAATLDAGLVAVTLLAKDAGRSLRAARDGQRADPLRSREALRGLAAGLREAWAR